MEYPPASIDPSGSSVRAPSTKSSSTRRQQLAFKFVIFAMTAMVGMNDSATGANLSSMQAYYGVSYDTISLLFLANRAGSVPPSPSPSAPGSRPS